MGLKQTCIKVCDADEIYAQPNPPKNKINFVQYNQFNNNFMIQSVHENNDRHYQQNEFQFNQVNLTNRILNFNFLKLIIKITFQILLSLFIAKHTTFRNAKIRPFHSISIIPGSLNKQKRDRQSIDFPEIQQQMIDSVQKNSIMQQLEFGQIGSYQGMGEDLEMKKMRQQGLFIKIKQLSSHNFDHLITSLETLPQILSFSLLISQSNLSQGHLQLLSNSISQKQQLKHLTLHLKDCRLINIQSICQAIAELKQLESLDISIGRNNKLQGFSIEELNTSLLKLNNLKHLSLCFSKTKIYQSDLFPIEFLRSVDLLSLKLDLSETSFKPNQLKLLLRRVQGQKELQKLSIDLSYCELDDIVLNELWETIQKLEDLRFIKLKLVFCQLQQIHLMKIIELLHQKQKLKEIKINFQSNSLRYIDNKIILDNDKVQINEKIKNKSLKENLQFDLKQKNFENNKKNNKSNFSEKRVKSEQILVSLPNDDYLIDYLNPELSFPVLSSFSLNLSFNKLSSLDIQNLYYLFFLMKNIKKLEILMNETQYDSNFDFQFCFQMMRKLEILNIRALKNQSFILQNIDKFELLQDLTLINFKSNETKNFIQQIPENILYLHLEISQKNIEIFQFQMYKKLVQMKNLLKLNIVFLDEKVCYENYETVKKQINKRKKYLSYVQFLRNLNQKQIEEILLFL